METSIDTKENFDESVSSATQTPDSDELSAETVSHFNVLLECRRSFVRHKRSVVWCAVGAAFVAFCAEAVIRPEYSASSYAMVEQVDSPSVTHLKISRQWPTPEVVALTATLNRESTAAGIRQTLRDDAYSVSEATSMTTRRDLVSKLLRFAHLGGQEPDSLPRLLSHTYGHVRLTSDGNEASMFNLRCDSNSPLLAKRYCEELQAELQRAVVASRGDAAIQISRLLMQKSAAAKSRSGEAESALAHIGRASTSASEGSDHNALDPMLERLEAELVEARAETIAREVELDVAEHGEAVAGYPMPHFSAEWSDSAGRLEARFAAAAHREKLLEISFEGLEARTQAKSTESLSVMKLRRDAKNELLLSQALFRLAGEAGVTSTAQGGYVIRTAGIVSVQPISIYPQRIAFIGAMFLLGTLAGMGVALFRDRKRNVLRTPSEVVRHSKLRELGVIPSTSESTRPFLFARSQKTACSARKETSMWKASMWDDPGSLVAESYRNAMFSAMLEEKVKWPAEGETPFCRIYVVSSPRKREGKSTVASNLGIALSKSNKRVTLIDANLHKPVLHHVFDLPHGLGLRGALAGDIVHYDLDVTFSKSTRFPNLNVIPVGGGGVERDMPEHSSQWKLLLDAVSRKSDYVLIDAPAVLDGPEFSLVAHHAHATILVLRAGISTLDELVQVREFMLSNDLSVLGTILNDFDPRREGLSDYYDPFYAYQKAARI